jgi:hypothetical protein
VVESRPEIVNNLTYHHAPPKCGCLPHLDDDEVLVRALRVDLREEA